MTSRSSPPYSIHLCGWPDCRRPVALSQWGCNTHWYSLAKELRDAIWQGWRVGKLSPEWIVANEAAQQWIKDIPARIAAANVTGGEPC